jgi:serine phosphatase RsbU (regulator of sigma subunit)
MYLIIDGSVEVIKGSDDEAMRLAQRGPGDVVGEMSFIEGQPRFATIRCLKTTRILELSEEAMRNALAEQPDLLYHTIQALSARLRQSDIQMIADLQKKNIELIRAYRELKEAQAALVEKEKLEHELELARELQESILPHRFPSLPGFSCMARYRPARQVGGDFYDVIRLDEKKVGLIMADVSGKGLTAALFMALTRSLIRAEARRNPSPSQVLLNVNRLLLEMSQSSMFVTVFYGILDIEQHTLHYVRAGHDRPILLSPASKECRFLEARGGVLGLMPSIMLEEVNIQLKLGDLLVLYTDGITDANSPESEFFEAERLHQIVCTATHTSTEDLCNLIFERVESFQADSAQYDDMAILVAGID